MELKKKHTHTHEKKNVEIWCVTNVNEGGAEEEASNEVEEKTVNDARLNRGIFFFISFASADVVVDTETME